MRKVNRYALQAQLKKTLRTIEESPSFEEFASFPSFNVSLINDCADSILEAEKYNCNSISEDDITPFIELTKFKSTEDNENCEKYEKQDKY